MRTENFTEKAQRVMRVKEYSDEELSYEVIRLAMLVHSELGPGLLESVYQNCLAIELDRNALLFEVEKPIKVTYDGQDVGKGFYIDILVEDRLVIELKAVDKITEKHIAQTLTYLKFSNVKYGLIINFNETKLKFGLKRIAL